MHVKVNSSVLEFDDKTFEPIKTYNIDLSFNPESFKDLHILVPDEVEKIINYELASTLLAGLKDFDKDKKDL